MGITQGDRFEYFAATQDMDTLASNMQEKIRLWRTHCAGKGLLALWQKKLLNYYGQAQGGNSSQAITQGGTEGEIALIKVNDLHSLLQEQLVTVTSQRPAGIARAINADVDSLKATKVGTVVSEYYMSQVGFEKNFVQAAETALLLDEAFLEVFWDKTAGEPVAKDEHGIPVMSGDVKLKLHCPWNAARDTATNVDDNKWYIFSQRVNKFEAAATYPKFWDDILKVEKDDLPVIPMNHVPDGSDVIWQHWLLHDRSAVLPNGRVSLLIGDKIVLDSELEFTFYPIGRITPGDVIDSGLGYSGANDIMALEEATDALNSIIITNQTKFGGMNILGPSGAGFNHIDLAKGSRFIEVDPMFVDKIKTLDLLHTAPEIFSYITELGGKKAKAVGSVSQVLSQQAAQGASGSSMALIQSQAISFNSGIQKSYYRLLSDIMTKVIGVLADFVDSPKMAMIVGKTNKDLLQSFRFTGKDLSGVASIVYEVVNPIQQTQGGRLTAAQDLLKQGLLHSPQQYLTLYYTGQMDALVGDDEKDQMNILEENEKLRDGKPVSAIVSENHANHMRSHLSQISPEDKIQNHQFVQDVLAHVQEHANQWQTATPAILMATGQQPLPPPPPPPGMMGPPQGPGGPQPMPPGPPPMAPHPMPPHGLPGNGKQPLALQADELRKPRMPNMPNIPNVPGTNQQAPVPGVNT